ncbi:P1 family peptidase [Halobacillus salinarum]|uniref:P1 family peptidase n=1 Tax=Halobacillus salinarum TaxID=2932257 RepID=A0ABY4EKE7_9BACI|nr:P1 family peptidase [Halobacillus salinarum]UOQ44946.1 P1 family peptidase [Halobacillus salinarum]
MQKRIRDYGLTIGNLTPGKKNAITDVEGVTVGHVTLSDGPVQTGVTAIIPHQDSLFQEKLTASSVVLNGFGKTMGTIQLNELGVLETPIILTNTLNVGTAADALIQSMLSNNPEIGRTTGTVNPVIGECNDMYLNDIRAQAVTKKHVWNALNTASDSFDEGSAGAGRGMVCYSLKGGIGTASRQMPLPHGTYTLGVLVLANFGRLSDLTIQGCPVGTELAEKLEKVEQQKDKGSIMIITATDLPVSDRQLNRILKRAATGLSRTGSTISHGSGDIVIGFSTVNRIPHKNSNQLATQQMIHEEEIDLPFRAMGEAVEEAVLNALITAESITGRGGHQRPALKDLIEEYDISFR